MTKKRDPYRLHTIIEDLTIPLIHLCVVLHAGKENRHLDDLAEIAAA